MPLKAAFDPALAKKAAPLTREEVAQPRLIAALQRVVDRRPD
ncbi:MAG: hypothetical protein ABWY20_00140 [Mycobacterium sp.]